jgi:hypothetical protein
MATFNLDMRKSSPNAAQAMDVVTHEIARRLVLPFKLPDWLHRHRVACTTTCDASLRKLQLAQERLVPWIVVQALEKHVHLEVTQVRVTSCMRSFKPLEHLIILMPPRMRFCNPHRHFVAELGFKFG